MEALLVEKVKKKLFIDSHEPVNKNGKDACKARNSFDDRDKNVWDDDSDRSKAKNEKKFFIGDEPANKNEMNASSTRDKNVMDANHNRKKHVISSFIKCPRELSTLEKFIANTGVECQQIEIDLGGKAFESAEMLWRLDSIPGLEEVVLSNCVLKVPRVTATDLPSSIKVLRLNRCQILDKVYDDEGDMFFFDDLMDFPKLEEIHVTDCTKNFGLCYTVHEFAPFLFEAFRCDAPINKIVFDKSGSDETQIRGYLDQHNARWPDKRIVVAVDETEEGKVCVNYEQIYSATDS